MSDLGRKMQELMDSDHETAVKLIDFMMAHCADYVSQRQLELRALARMKRSVMLGTKVLDADADKVNNLLARVFGSDPNKLNKLFLEELNGKSD